MISRLINTFVFVVIVFALLQLGAYLADERIMPRVEIEKGSEVISAARDQLPSWAQIERKFGEMLNEPESSSDNPTDQTLRDLRSQNGQGSESETRTDSGFVLVDELNPGKPLIRHF